MKKAADAKKKLVKKLTKTQEKAKAKILRPFEMMRLAINNKQAEAKIGSFQAILFDLITNKRSKDESIPPLTITPVSSAVLLRSANSSRQSIQQKKVVFAQAKAVQLNYQSILGQGVQQARSFTPLSPT